MSKTEYLREYRRKRKAAASGYIYALSDPRTDEVRYVGRTYHPTRRLAEHLREAEFPYTANQDKKDWILGLLDSKLKPVMTILEVCSQSEMPRRERYWIARMKRSGVTLLNKK